MTLTCSMATTMATAIGAGPAGSGRKLPHPEEITMDTDRARRAVRHSERLAKRTLRYAGSRKDVGRTEAAYRGIDLHALYRETV